MKRIGISVSRSRLAAFAWEKTLLAGRPLGACDVACTEPFGSPDDIRSLAATLREGLGGAVLPPAVLSLPPELCYLRVLDLPVSDLKDARIIHATEIEGSLPVDDEEILSDLLPMSGSEKPGGRFIAFAVRRSVIDRFTDAFTEAGMRLENVVTDPVSLLCAASALQASRSFSLASFETDVILLSVAELSLRKVRQLPAAILDTADSIRHEAPAFLDESGPLFFAGPVETVQAALPGKVGAPLLPPGDFDQASVVAFGASLVSFSGKITHGFTLAGGQQTVEDEARRLGRLKIAAIATLAAILSCVAALEVARWTATRQVAAVRRQLRAEFTAAVPEAKVIVRETTQIREKILAVQRQRAELGLDLPKVTPLLATISTTLPGGKSLTVKEISIDGNRIRVAGESTGGTAVESYRTALSSAFGTGFSVTVQESRGSARGENVNFTILIEKGSSDRAS
jgi:type II secretion system protein L